MQLPPALRPPRCVYCGHIIWPWEARGVRRRYSGLPIYFHPLCYFWYVRNVPGLLDRYDAFEEPPARIKRLHRRRSLR